MYTCDTDVANRRSSGCRTPLATCDVAVQVVIHCSGPVALRSGPKHFEVMGARAGDIPLEAALQIVRRRESERFVDRSHPSDSFIWCSTPQCEQSWLCTSRLSRTNQVCLSCGRTWHSSYLQNGYDWWLPQRNPGDWCFVFAPVTDAGIMVLYCRMSL